MTRCVYGSMHVYHKCVCLHREVWQELHLPFGALSMQGFENKNGYYRTQLGPRGCTNNWSDEKNMAHNRFSQVVESEQMTTFFSTQQLVPADWKDECKYRGKCKHCKAKGHYLPTCPEIVTNFDDVFVEDPPQPQYLAWLRSLPAAATSPPALSGLRDAAGGVAPADDAAADLAAAPSGFASKKRPRDAGAGDGEWSPPKAPKAAPISTPAARKSNKAPQLLLLPRPPRQAKDLAARAMASQMLDEFDDDSSSRKRR